MCMVRYVNLIPKEMKPCTVNTYKWYYVLGAWDRPSIAGFHGILSGTTSDYASEKGIRCCVRRSLGLAMYSSATVVVHNKMRVNNVAENMVQYVTFLVMCVVTRSPDLGHTQDLVALGTPTLLDRFH